MIVLVELLYGEALRVVLGLKPPIHSREGVFTNENLSLCESLVLQRGLRGSSKPNFTGNISEFLFSIFLILAIPLSFHSPSRLCFDLCLVHKFFLATWFFLHAILCSYFFAKATSRVFH